MRVLHVTNSRELSGGVKQIGLLMEGLRLKNISQALVCPPRSPVAGFFIEAKFPVHPVAIAQDYDLLAAWRLSRIIRDGGFNIVHAHHAMAHAIVLLVRHWEFFKLVVSRRVTHPIPWYPTSRWKYRNSRIERYLCVSQAVREVLAKAGVDAGRLAVVPSSTDLDRFSARAPSRNLLKDIGFNGGGIRPILGMVANYSAWKGHDIFVEALSKLPTNSFWALIAGRDTDSELFKTKVKNSGIAPQVRLLGWRNDAPELLSVMSALVCPSLSGEGSSGSIREAFAMKIPVIASDIAANKELVGEQRGWLFKNADAQDLAQALEGFLEGSPVDRSLRINRARAFVEESFSASQMVDNTIGIYRELLGE